MNNDKIRDSTAITIPIRLAATQYHPSSDYRLLHSRPITSITSVHSFFLVLCFHAMSDDIKDMKLPKGWVKTYSNSQQRYYYSHKDTKHTQWHFPTASEADDPWMAKRRAEENEEKERKRAVDVPAVAATTVPAKRQRVQPSNVDTLLALADTTNVAIIVPYRDLHVEQARAAHLKKFIPHMIDFLGKLQRARKISDFHVYIVEQSNDGRKFNRGKLLNIGFDLARKAKKHDAFIFHDVDLLPQEDLGDAYAAFPKVPYHIARVWDRYSNNPKYFGGIVSFSSSDFKRINGYPNTFWGWGGEDDELQLRCQAIGLKWDWPKGKGTIVDLEDMTLDDKLQFLRQHKEWKCMVKWEALKEHDTTWRTNGLADLQYKKIEESPLDGKDLRRSKATKISVDVKLNGNHWANDRCGVDFMGDWNK